MCVGWDYFFLPYGEIVLIAMTNCGGLLLRIVVGWILVATMFIGFFMFYIWHDDVSAAYGGLYCTTAYNCYLWGFQNAIKGNLPKSWGIKWATDNGGIAEDFHHDNWLQLQWLLGMISFAIFRYSWAGIIKATVCGCFGKLSKKTAATAADTAGKCLVCSINKFTLEDYGGMYMHTNEHHNPYAACHHQSSAMFSHLPCLQMELSGLHCCSETKTS